MTRGPDDDGNPVVGAFWAITLSLPVWAAVAWWVLT